MILLDANVLIALGDGNHIFHQCRRLFKTGFLACSKPDSLLEAESA